LIGKYSGSWEKRSRAAFGETKKGTLAKRLADITKAREPLGWKHLIDLHTLRYISEKLLELLKLIVATSCGTKMK
jgi:nucleoside-diphosphate-sugar epimerase